MRDPSDRSTRDAHYAPYPPQASPPTMSDPLGPPPPPSSSGRPGGKRSSSTNGSFDNEAPAKRSKSSQSLSTLGEETQYKVARAISSCTRCRSRKQKCDGKLPACSACERAKVECIGFDAISKTNISRNYLHSLEQEVQVLRLQVASLTNGNGMPDIASVLPTPSSSSAPLPKPSPTFSHTAPTPLTSFSRSDLMIDPSLQNEGPDSALRSPWDSPGFPSGRRHSDFPFPSTPGSASDTPRSPYFNRPPPYQGATSLTRMVHDAALRTGHAHNDSAAIMQPHAPSSAAGSEKGSAVDSPADNGAGDGVSPNDLSGLKRLAAASSPLATSASVSSKGSKRKAGFSVPPLPPQPAVERLVAAYVDFVGVTAPIIHIPTLGKQLIKIRNNTDVEQSDVFVVMMVLALSTMASSRFVDPPDELRACSEAFHAEAMKHLDAVFEDQSYVGLQAILLLVWYSLLNPDKGSIWFLVGLATRTCVDLGFHNEENASVDQLDSLELDMRRRLFWCTYKMDRLLCISLGRPPSIPDGYINVPLPSGLHDVDIHANHFGQMSGEPCAYKAVFMHTTKLRQLQSEILDHTYGIYRPSGGADHPSQGWFDDCFERLKTWLATAPEPRGTVSTEGYAISFHNSALLLFRPSPGNPRPGRQALSVVLASSSYIIRIHRRMQLNNRISWLWMTSHFSFMAGLSFLYSFYNLYSVGGGQGVPTIEEAMTDIESCLAVLDYLTPRVPSAQACHDTMQALSKAIIERLSRSAQQDNVSSPTGVRALIPRTAPISSSRDDPLPNPNESFPVPLPAVTLPYELSLLDNLFINPMSSHVKASDYTNGNKSRCQGNKNCAENGQKATGNINGNSVNSQNAQNFSTQGFPPSAFGGTGITPLMSSNGTSDSTMGALSALQAYGIAAQMGTSNNNNNNALNIQNINTNNINSNHSNSNPQINQNGNNAGGQQQGAKTVNEQTSNQTMGAGAGPNDTGFDLLSFLMDEEGGLGTGTWDALDVPADYSLWS